MERNEILVVLQRETESAQQRSEQLRQMHTHLPDANEQHAVFRMALAERQLAESLQSVAKALRNGWEN